jgi:Do/DeqQ family serine protease
MKIGELTLSLCRSDRHAIASEDREIADRLLAGKRSKGCRRPSKAAAGCLYLASLIRGVFMMLRLRVPAISAATMSAATMSAATMSAATMSAAVAVLLAALLQGAGAQERRVPSSPGELQLSFAPIVQRVAPAVVNVYATHVVENRNPFLADPFFRQFFGAVPREQVERSLGSGVIVDPAGLVVTNFHVIDGASEVKIALSDKREFDADIVLKDQRSDLAVLRVKGASEQFPVLEFGNSDALQVGDVVLAIGDPFGVGQTVTHGIVSAVARTQVGISDYQFFIQTDAAINPGNSGGALVDMNGRLVGINSAIVSRSGGSQGIGFAIPANMVRVVVASARGGSAAVKRPWLGAKLQDVTPEIADSLGLKRPGGALVASVVTGGPAARAGIKTGDLIATIDGVAIEDPNAFDYRFATKPLGGVAQVGLLRQGHDVVVPVALQALPDTPRDEVQIRAQSPFLGATVANLSPALADELRLDPQADGVVITAVADGSPAQSIGFQKGDIVRSVNNQKIAKSADLERITSAGGRQWRVTIDRGGQQISVMFSG